MRLLKEMKKHTLKTKSQIMFRKNPRAFMMILFHIGICCMPTIFKQVCANVLQISSFHQITHIKNVIWKW